jgi:FAD/FMN-containing dehydrogenase
MPEPKGSSMTLTTPLSDLAARVEGGVITPDHPDYDRARSAWNLAFAHRPAVIVEAASVSDVVEAVKYAAASGARVAIQGTGHGVTTLADEAVLVLTGRLDDVEIDPVSRSARLGAGVTWGPVLAAAQMHGLAPLLGSSPGVGAIGYTLGGGFGWLGRRYGLSVDHARAFTVVTADGAVVRADADQHPDLFWALRGAGMGSLGVVVEMEIDLFPVTLVYAGNLLYPIEMAADVFDFYRQWSADLPEEMTSSFALMNFPPLEVVPEPLRGQSLAVVRGCHSGDETEAAALVDEWRSWRAPAIDMFGPMPFSEAATISNDPADPMPGMTGARWLKGLDSNVFEAVLEAMSADGGAPSPFVFIEIRHAGGAISRPVAGASYSSRAADRLLEAVAPVFDPAARPVITARLERLWDRLGPSLADGAYLNFLEGEDRVAATRQAFDTATFRRLAETKRRYDPSNVFGHGLDLTE